MPAQGRPLSQWLNVSMAYFICQDIWISLVSNIKEVWISQDLEKYQFHKYDTLCKDKPFDVTKQIMKPTYSQPAQIILFHKDARE